MKVIALNFKQEDEGLNLTCTVNFPDKSNIMRESFNVAGLAEWRHVPANVVHVNENTISILNLKENSKNFSKIGMNWIGIKARTDILLSFAVRHGRNGTKKVQEQLTKFFKACGASSIKFSVLDVERYESNQATDTSGGEANY